MGAGLRAASNDPLPRAPLGGHSGRSAHPRSRCRRRPGSTCRCPRCGRTGSFAGPGAAPRRHPGAAAAAGRPRKARPHRCGPWGRPRSTCPGTAGPGKEGRGVCGEREGIGLRGQGRKAHTCAVRGEVAKGRPADGQTKRQRARQPDARRGRRGRGVWLASLQRSTCSAAGRLTRGSGPATFFSPRSSAAASTAATKAR